MAGLGRRTHYRKHLTDAVLHEYPIPNEHERFAKVVATRGGNHFDIILARKHISNHEEGLETSATDEEETRQTQLCLLPTKFRKLVFIKRGDFVIVETSVDEQDDDNESTGSNHDNNGGGGAGGGGGIRCIIRHILYRDQVKHLKTKGLWPTSDAEFNNEAEMTATVAAAAAVTAASTGDHISSSARQEDTLEPKAVGGEDKDDGIVYADYNCDDYDADDLQQQDAMFVNTNRLAHLVVQDSSDSSDEGE
jgi:probable RNA-binding protein EIF1AD